MNATLASSLICSWYIDVNTSSRISTHIVNETVFMTRHSNCFPDLQRETTEGGWQFAFGHLLDSTKPTTIKMDHGFLQTGSILPNQIRWTNNAVWRMPIASTYWSRSTSKNYILVNTSDFTQFDVLDEGIYNNKLSLTCNRVVWNNLHGTIQENMITWADGNIWIPTTTLKTLDKTHSYDYETYDYETYDSETYDYETYDKVFFGTK